jgi:hypothetical protein
LTLVENSLFERINRKHCTLKRLSNTRKTVVLGNWAEGTFFNGERVKYLLTLPINDVNMVAFCSTDSNEKS